MFVLGAEQFDFLQWVSQRCQALFLRFDAVENRGFFLERITQGFQAFFGDIENQVTLGAVILGQTLEVVLDAGDGIGQGVQALPVGHGLACQQLLLNVAIAGVEQVGCTLQRNHRQAATDLGQQAGHAGQMLVIPLRGDELDDRVLGLLQAIARFLDHQLMDLRHVGGGQVALFVLAVVTRADHTGQGRLDIQQGAGDVHQHRIVGFTLPQGQAVNHVDLVENHLARLAETEHRQGIGNLLERCQQGVQFADLTAITAHEQIEAVLDPYQLFTQRGDHRTHGIAVRAG